MERERRERMEKEGMENMVRLQQQVQIETERREQVERERAAELEKANRVVDRLSLEKRELEKKLEEEDDKMMEEDKQDVYVMDEEMIQAGPYYNVRAASSASMEDEIVLGNLRGPKRKEAGFNIKGEGRLEKVIWRHRLDVGQNITASFNLVNMTCSGCPGSGVHSVVGAEDGSRCCSWLATKFSSGIVQR
jgi:hypothetical protein